MKVLYTDRIRLRNFCRQDINDMYEFCSQSEIEMVGWSAHKNIEETKKVLEQWILNENIFAIVAKNTNKVIGYIAVHADSEEGRSDILYVWACCFQNNISSKNLIEKMGFKFMQEGKFYSESFKKEIPSYEYRMSKDDWKIEK